METKRNTQLLLPLILLGVLFSQTWAWPASEEALRNARQVDDSSFVDDHSLKDYPESLIEKRVSDDFSKYLRQSKRDDTPDPCLICLTTIDKSLHSEAGRFPKKNH